MITTIDTKENTVEDCLSAVGLSLRKNMQEIQFVGISFEDYCLLVTQQGSKTQFVQISSDNTSPGDVFEGVQLTTGIGRFTVIPDRTLSPSESVIFVKNFEPNSPLGYLRTLTELKEL